MLARVLATILVCVTACTPGETGTRRDVARCADCEITLRHVGLLSDSLDPGALPDRMVYATRDRAGRLYIVSRQGTSLLVYGADGTLIKRVGQRGDGPGEFRVIRRVLIGPGDSVHVGDWGQGRITVLAPDLTFVRTQVAFDQPEMVLGDGRYLMTEPATRPHHLTDPFRLTNADGTLVRAFGADSSPEHAASYRSARRIAAPAKNGDLWSAVRGRYVLERWDPSTGTRTQIVTVASPSFADDAAWRGGDPSWLPPVVETLWEDGDGLVWVLIRETDPAWISPPEFPHVERATTPEEYDAQFNWAIEAIDPATGRVLASKRFPNVLWSRAPSTVLVSERSMSAHAATYDVWEAVLVPRRP